MNDSKAVVVFMTAPKREEAERIAEILVKERLAACVQILPEITSFYHWQGKIERDREILILAKTTTDKSAELEKVVRENHSYQVPEIVAVPTETVSEPYLAWLIAETNNQ
ncbi:MAG: divalent-cation tolerance protein CutA [Acidobacteriota bacterium]|nr:divalent-cation tolerance protein CutA [Acidobacteriota bacterium]